MIWFGAEHVTVGETEAKFRLDLFWCTVDPRISMFVVLITMLMTFCEHTSGSTADGMGRFEAGRPPDGPGASRLRRWKGGA